MKEKNKNIKKKKTHFLKKRVKTMCAVIRNLINDSMERSVRRKEELL